MCMQVGFDINPGSEGVSPKWNKREQITLKHIGPGLIPTACRYSIYADVPWRHTNTEATKESVYGWEKVLTERKKEMYA